MKHSIQKRLAADILKVGISRIWIDSANKEEVSKAITREDVRGLVVRNIIQAKPKKGVSRVRAKKLAEQRSKGRRKGEGRKKGTFKARNPKKRLWINQIRPLRAFLKILHEKGVLNSTEHRKLYLKSKGNFFRNRAHLKSYIDKMKKE